MWKVAVTSGGGISLGGSSEQYRLHQNGVRFHDLSFEELRDALVGLTTNLLLPGMNTVIDQDHVLLWSWCGEILLGAKGPLLTQAEPEVSRLAATTLRAALANTRPPTKEAFERSRAASELMEHNERQFLAHAHDALAYLAFPLLEAVTRRACAQYVDLTGKVLIPFPRSSGKTYAVNSRCSSVGDLLQLMLSTVASDGLRADLEELLDHVHALQPETDSGQAVIFVWRNSSLHGEASLPTIGGTVLTLALRIAVDELRDIYPRRKEEAMRRIEWELQTARVGTAWSPSPWNYYPPFL
jgi:hypothetical protein